jgi:hypothetical protein
MRLVDLLSFLGEVVEADQMEEVAVEQSLEVAECWMKEVEVEGCQRIVATKH